MDHSTYDFVVVGAGQNQLSAAAYLAASGFGVLVLERQAFYGGGAASHEITVPGFIHDVHATNIFLAQANPLLKHDELGLLSKFGLRFADKDKDAAQGTVFPDGEVMALFMSIEESCESIAQFSPADADAYRKFVRRAEGLMGIFELALFLPPAEPKTLLAVFNGSAEGREMLELMEAGAWDLISGTFENSRTRTHLLRLMSEMMLDPLAPGTAFGLLLMLGMYHRYKSGYGIGGAQAFSDALVRCLKHHGGEIRVNTEVTKIVLSGNQATGVQTNTGEIFNARKAVVAGIPPWSLSSFVKGTELLTHRAKQVPTCDYTTFTAHIALNEPPAPLCDEKYHKMGFTIMAENDPEKVLAITSASKAGKLPKDFSGAYVCATNHDPSRAPAGQATLYLYHIVPTQLANSVMEDWENVTQEFGDWLIENTRKYVPNLSSNHILGVKHHSPYWVQESSPSYQKGDVSGLGMFPDQFIYGRPTAELAHYSVPGIKNLYLCGPFMHPGGGVNGGGRATAIQILMDMDCSLQAFRL
jgi:phytoene dehydrogenase-like protein